MIKPRHHLRLLISALNKARDLESPSRRRFLQGATAVTIAASFPKVLRGQTREIGILGAGVAGLSAAYSLSALGYRVSLFEGQERVGGRIWTQGSFNNDQMFIERGGELIDSDHDALRNLATTLGLEIESLDESQKKFSDIYYYNDRAYREADLIPLFRPLAQKISRDQARSPQEWDQMNLHEYLGRFKDTTDAWLLEMLRQAYVNEYGLEADELSAMNFVGMIGTDVSEGFKIFGDSDERWRIKGGNEQLPQRLLKRLQERKTSVSLACKVVRVEQTASGRLRIHYKHGSANRHSDFQQVICTLPFSTLRHLGALEGLNLSAEKRHAIQTLGYGTNSKLMLGFKSKVWRDGVGICNGSMLTSLPSQQFWETSRAQSGTRGILTNFMGGKRGASFSASQIPEVLKDLEKMHPGSEKSFEKTTTLMKWPDFEWSRGSYSCPKVGQVTGLLPYVGTTELKGQLLFAGEHTSPDYQGFMNGGVEQGLRAAKEISSL